MTKRMLIDATHAEETRVVVLDGNRIEDFDVETSAKKQLKGNIYLAKVVRVEPSLQAAFVEYGGGRHGFLAFGEIHPDYYQIPVADRQRLLAMQAEEARAEAEAEDDEVIAGGRPRPPSAPIETLEPEALEAATTQDDPTADEAETEAEIASDPAPVLPGDRSGPDDEIAPDEFDDRAGPAQPMTMARDERFGPADAEVAETPIESLDLDARETTTEEPPEPIAPSPAGADTEGDDEGFPDLDAPEEAAPPPETIGGETESSGSDDARRRRESRFLRNYRIQEVIRRRQIMLIQVVKEERGTKGAALTTYISLAGRFSVLMPNSPRGGGISRKITSAADRRRLKEVTAELDLPQGMGLIVRTAGANRPKPEIKRDCEYLMRLWDDIRELTLRSVAPALIYEEASLIKRAIRDGYSRDIEEVIVDGEPGWRAAHEFMRMLMPSHAKKVQLWRGEGGQPLFAKHQVEAQLDAMLSPTVQLKSGGYLVINQTEALVAIDVNSGRSTRERGIEETAYRTNLEAADEAARQLRLRDLAGLIVIDFIDMESRKNNVAVERRLKDALRADRARIQVGTISHFGLMEMSRQRLRPSVTETSFIACPHCGGSGHVRSTESAAIHVLRAIEDEGARGRSAVIMVHAASSLVMYLLNHKRDRLTEIEVRCGMRVQFAMDETLMPPAHRIDKVRARTPEDRPIPALPVAPAPPPFDATDEIEEAPDVEDDDEPETETIAAVAAPRGDAVQGARAETAEEGERRRKRRRRRRGGRRDTETGADAAAGSQDSGEPGDDGDDEPAGDAATAAANMTILEPSEDPSAGPTADASAEPAAVVADPPADAIETPAAEVAPDEDAADAEGASNRRRGRRGGRRRRRDETEPPVAGEASAEQPIAQPAYTGPTPADPFGGTGFDIYDLLDTAPSEQRPGPVAPPAEPIVEPAALEPIEPATNEPPPAELGASAPKATELAAAEPPVEAAAQEASPPAPQQPVAAQEAAEPETVAEPVIGAPVQPVVIGDVATPEPKRGWWRR